VRATLATRLEHAGKQQDAEALLKEATQTSGSTAAWQLLSDFYRRTGDLTASESALARAIELGGERGELLRFTRADLLAHLGELDRAQAIASELTDPTLRELLHGRLLAARGDYGSAMAAFDAGRLGGHRRPNVRERVLR